MKPEEIVATMLVIAERCGLTITALAAAAGTSTSTIERVVQRKELPQHLAPRMSIQKFVDLNKHATRRGEVRFVEL